MRRWSDVVSMRPCCSNSSSRWRSYSSSRLSRSDAQRLIIVAVWRRSNDLLGRTTARVDVVDAVAYFDRSCSPRLSLQLATAFVTDIAEFGATSVDEVDAGAAAAAICACWRSSSSRRRYSRTSASMKSFVRDARITSLADISSDFADVAAICQHCNNDLQRITTNAFDVDLGKSTYTRPANRTSLHNWYALLMGTCNRPIFTTRECSVVKINAFGRTSLCACLSCSGSNFWKHWPRKYTFGR